jgi:hypothetical protein
MYTLNPNRNSRGPLLSRSNHVPCGAAFKSRQHFVATSRQSAAASPRARDRSPRRGRVAAHCGRVVDALSTGAGNHLFECVSPCCEPWTFNIVASGQVAHSARRVLGAPHVSTPSTPFEYAEYHM